MRTIIAQRVNQSFRVAILKSVRLDTKGGWKNEPADYV